MVIRCFPGQRCPIVQTEYTLTALEKDKRDLPGSLEFLSDFFPCKRPIAVVWIDAVWGYPVEKAMWAQVTLPPRRRG